MGEVTLTCGCAINIIIILVVVVVVLTLSAHTLESYSTQFVSQSVSQSVTQQKADLEDGGLPKIDTSIKMLHWTI